ncbi:MAG: ribosomal protein S18-alanine N-acetyltransferase [Endomicrobium sp.]|jgi:ribosomal-protein-alanine N-acetyltransferase|nr:ribosomal protein S18-alanine N-acetyltransferase [Endomicrobium sp.]
MKFLPFSYIFLDDIIKIENNSFPNPWTKEMFLSSAKNSSVLFNVLILNKTIIGYYIIVLVKDEMEILNIAVNQQFRNKSFGKSILFDILNIANTKKIKYVFLEARESNKIALKLYKNFGFNEIGIRKKYYKTENALMLKLCL